MKCNQSRPGFELVSPCSFPTAITTTPRAPPTDGDTDFFDIACWDPVRKYIYIISSYNLATLRRQIVSRSNERKWFHAKKKKKKGKKQTISDGNYQFHR